MKYKMKILCDEERKLGFTLSSFYGIIHVSSKIEAKSAIKALLKNPENGLIVIYNNLVDLNDPEMEDLLRLSFPLIVVIPNSKYSYLSEEELLVELLRRSIGISVKI